MTKRKVKPVAEVTPEPVFTITGPVTDVVVINESAPQNVPDVAGAAVVYVAPNGSRQPAIITERYGTHSALLLTDGTALESVRHDEGKAAGTYHFAE